MASILKVSQLQKPDGSTPTAADLGIDVAGSVVGYYRHNWGSNTTLSSTSFVVASGSSFIYTPKSSNSKLYILSDLASRVNANQNGFIQRVFVDGVNVNSSQGGQHEFYSGFTGTDLYARQAKSAEYLNTSTSPKTIDVRVANHNAGSDNRVNFADNFESSVIVLEIAQ